MYKMQALFQFNTKIFSIFHKQKYLADITLW